MIVELVSANSMPKVMVSSLGLAMVPVATLKTRDEVGINARLESMEQGLGRVTEVVTKFTSNVKYNVQSKSIHPSESAIPSVSISPPPTMNQQRSFASATASFLPLSL